MAELEVRKTYKLYVGGEFIRTESGRYDPVRLEGRGDPAKSPADARARTCAKRSARRGGAAGWAGKTPT